MATARAINRLPLHLPVGKITRFIKKNAVTVIAFFAALATTLIIPPDSAYLGYLDFVKGEKLAIEHTDKKLPRGRTLVYLLLFALSIAIVFRGIPYWLGLIIIPSVLFFMDRSALKKVDYPLLLTFVFFFIFAGNMARIDVVRNAFGFLLEKNTLIFSALSCQCIRLEV